MSKEINPKFTPIDNYGDGNGEGQIIIIGGDDTEEYYVTISLYDGASSNSITYSNPGIISISITDGDETLDYTNGTSDYVFLLSSTGRKYWSVLTDSEYYFSANGSKNINSTITSIRASLIRVYHYVFTINAGNITQSNITLTYPTTGATLTFNSNQNSMISSSSTSTTIDFYTAYDKVSIGISLAGYISYTSQTINGIFTISNGNIDNTVFTNITLIKVQNPQYQYIFSIKYDDININSSNYDIDVEGNNINNNIFISEETSINDYSISFKNKIYYDGEISDTEIEIPDKYVINKNKCINCGTCETLCPEGAIFINDNERYEINNNCLGISCGQCLSVCSEEAIELNNTVNINIDISNFENSNDIKYYIPINVVDKSTGNIVKSISPTYHKIGDDITIDVSKEDTYYNINGTCSVTITEEMVKNLLRNESYIYNKEIDFNDFQIEYKNVNIISKLHITDKNNTTLTYGTNYIIKSGKSDNTVLDPTSIEYNTIFYIQPKDTTLYTKSGNQRVISEDGDIIDFNITLKDAKNNYPADKYCMPWYINNIKVKYELKDKLSSNTKEFERIVDIYLRDNKSCVSNNSKIIIKPGQNLEEAKDSVNASQFYMPMQEKIDGKVYKFDIPLYKEVYPAHMFIKQDDSQQVLTLHKYINTYTQLRYRTGNESETNNEIFGNINGEYSIDFHFTENNLNNTESYTDIQSKIFSSNYSNGINTIILNSSQIPYDENNNYVYTGTMLIYPTVNDHEENEYKYRSYLGCKYDININKEKIEFDSFNEDYGFITYIKGGNYSYEIKDNQYTFYEAGTTKKKNISGNNINEYYPNLEISSDYCTIKEVKNDTIKIDYSLDSNQNIKNITFNYKNTPEFNTISGTFTKKIESVLYPEIIDSNGIFTYSTTNDNKFSYYIKINSDSFSYKGFDENMISGNLNVSYIIKYESQKYDYDNNIISNQSNKFDYLLNNDLKWKIKIRGITRNYKYKGFDIDEPFYDENLSTGNSNGVSSEYNDYIYYESNSQKNKYKYFSYIKQFIPENDLINYIKLNETTPLYLPNNSVNIYNEGIGNQSSNIYYVSKYDNIDISYSPINSSKTINNLTETANISYYIYKLIKQDNRFYLNNGELSLQNSIKITDSGIQYSPGYSKLNSDITNFSNYIYLNISDNEITKNTDIEQVIFNKRYTQIDDLRDKKYEWDSEFGTMSKSEFDNAINNLAGTNEDVSSYIRSNILNPEQYYTNISGGNTDGINEIIFNYVKDNYSTNDEINMQHHTDNYPYTYNNLNETYTGKLSNFLNDISKHFIEKSILDNAYELLNEVKQHLTTDIQNIDLHTFDPSHINNFDEHLEDRYQELLEYSDINTEYYLCKVRLAYNSCFETNFDANSFDLTNKVSQNCYVGYLTNTYTADIFINLRNNISILETNVFTFENYNKMNQDNISDGLPTSCKIGYIDNSIPNSPIFYIFNDSDLQNQTIGQNIISTPESYYMIQNSNINNSYFDKNIITNNNLIYNGTTDTYTYWYLTNNDNNIYNYIISKSIKDNYDNNLSIYNNVYNISNDETELNNIYDKIKNNSNEHTTINNYISTYIYYQLNQIKTTYNNYTSKITNYNESISTINTDQINHFNDLYNEITYTPTQQITMYDNFSNDIYFSNETTLYTKIGDNYLNLRGNKNLAIIYHWQQHFEDYYKLINGYRFLYKAYLYNKMLTTQSNYEDEQKRILENAAELFYNYWLNQLYLNKQSLTGNEFKYNNTTAIQTNTINSILSDVYKLKCKRCYNTNIYYFDNDLYENLPDYLTIRYYISSETINNIDNNTNSSHANIFNGVINNNLTNSISQTDTYIHFGLFNKNLFIKKINVINNTLKYVYNINEIYKNDFINLTITKGNKQINFTFTFNDSSISNDNIVYDDYKLELLYTITDNYHQQPTNKSVLLERGEFNDISDYFDTPNKDKNVYIISYRLKLTNKYDNDDYIYGKIYNKIFYYNEAIYDYDIKDYSEISNLTKEGENDIVDVKLLLDYSRNNNHTYFCSFAKTSENGILFSYISKYNDGNKKELNSLFKLDPSYPTYNFSNKANNSKTIDIEIK